MTAPGGRHARPALPAGRRILIAAGILLALAIAVGGIPIISLFVH